MIVSKAMNVPFNMPLYAQLDADTKSDPVCHSAGCTQYNWMDALRKKEDEPVQYKTDQGLEEDVISTWDNLDVAERQKNHNWIFNHEIYALRNKKTDPLAWDHGDVLDEDIVNTQGHLSAAENKLGNWDIFDRSKITKK